MAFACLTLKLVQFPRFMVVLHCQVGPATLVPLGTGCKYFWYIFNNNSFFLYLSLIISISLLFLQNIGCLPPNQYSNIPSSETDNYLTFKRVLWWGTGSWIRYQRFYYSWLAQIQLLWTIFLSPLEVEFVLFHKLVSMCPELMSSSQLAFISPYRHQVKQFQEWFKETFGELVDMTTTDGCQVIWQCFSS